MEHTPTPWYFNSIRIYASGENWASIATICNPRPTSGDPSARPEPLSIQNPRFEEGCANGEFIVRACNDYDGLKQHIAELEAEIEQHESMVAEYAAKCSMLETANKHIADLEEQLEQVRRLARVVCPHCNGIGGTCPHCANGMMTALDRIAELEADISKITATAIEVLSSQLCAMHQEIVKNMDFYQFVEKEKFIGCNWCAYEHIAELKAALKQTREAWAKETRRRLEDTYKD